MMKEAEGFRWQTEQFDDVKILRYQVPMFEQLSARERIFIYYLSQAALAGRDILWDQNNCYNLRLRRVLERVINDFQGDRTTEDFQAFMVYAKKVFFANGIHHHYSMDKFKPCFTQAYWQELLRAVGCEKEGQELERIIFDPEYMSKRVLLDADKDLIVGSANNYYVGVTQKEVESFYKSVGNGEQPSVSYGLNSTLIKGEDGVIREEVWKIGGKYSKELESVVYWLEQALSFACTLQQQKAMHLLIEYYKTGDLHLFDEYSIEWLKDTESSIDFINGFIEVYGDALAYKASWEAVVEIVDKEACERTRKLADNALWFEQHAPIDSRFKKSEVKGVTARVMQVAMLGGDCHPATPIGINLPNAEWIRERYGSKSVTLDNITYAYDMAASSSGVLDEFAASDEEIQLAREFGSLGSSLHTDLHECLGHGSGKMLPGVTSETLRNYYSTIEEARADLFALYYIMDPKMVDLGIMPSLEVAKAEYNSYIRNGLMVQLTRILPGNQLEESHMRNRQMIAAWVYEKGRAQGIIERIGRNGKTYFMIHDYEGLRCLFGELLAEVQRIKSEGDFEAARTLIETYGVKVDSSLHGEVLERYRKLGVAPYAGFINPVYKPVMNEGAIVDVKIEYPDDFLCQMLDYGK
ncbi:MAG: dipeptidyl peptidase 3 [Odoribacter sp.]|nr:dipeptidyl peptidase 3 [Odoribacter sp.]MDY3033019.1 dihydrofolate reductase [Odoribacter sp.]